MSETVLPAVLEKPKSLTEIMAAEVNLDREVYVKTIKKTVMPNGVIDLRSAWCSFLFLSSFLAAVENIKFKLFGTALFQIGIQILLPYQKRRQGALILARALRWQLPMVCSSAERANMDPRHLLNLWQRVKFFRHDSPLFFTW